MCTEGVSTSIRDAVLGLSVGLICGGGGARFCFAQRLAVVFEKVGPARGGYSAESTHNLRYTIYDRVQESKRSSWDRTGRKTYLLG